MKMAGIASARHAGTMLDPASAAFSEQGDIEIANLTVFQGQFVENAIMGFDEGPAIFNPGSGVIADFGHFFRYGAQLPIRSGSAGQLLFDRPANTAPHLIKLFPKHRIADLLLQTL